MEQTQSNQKNYEKDPTKELLSCDKCDYQCKKENTLNKHKNTKREPQACKVCEQKSPNMVDMLKHVVDRHSNSNKKYIPKEHQEHKEVLELLEYECSCDQGERPFKDSLDQSIQWKIIVI